MTGYIRPQDFGSIADGLSHPLSTLYSTLPESQAVYPFATSLTNEIDWCAIQAALLEQQTTAINTFFPQVRPVALGRGAYVINRRLTRSGGGAILGDGPMSSQIVNNGGDGWFALDGGNLPASQIIARDFRCIPGAANAGLAFDITKDAQASSPYSDVVIEDVEILAGYGPEYCGGIVLENCWSPRVRVRYKGAGDPANWQDFITIRGRTIAPDLSGCIGAGCNIGVNINTAVVEGFIADGLKLDAVRRGIVKPAFGGLPPWYTIRNTHIAAVQGCIDIAGASSVKIADCVLYHGDIAGQATPPGSAAVRLATITELVVSRNTISGRNNPIPVDKTGIDIASSVTQFDIDGNYCDLFTRGVRVASGNPGPGIVRRGRYWGNGENVSNLSPSKVAVV